MKALVINSGNSSLKFQVTDSETGRVLAGGLCEWIGIDNRFTYKTDTGIPLREQTTMESHIQAVHIILDVLTDPEQGVISKFREIDVVGHHLVRGGKKSTGSVVITQEVVQAMIECNDLAPLHSPTNLMGVETYRTLIPDTLVVGMFDAAFSQTVEPRTFLYGLPYQYYEEHKICRYGFHDISHRHVSRRAAQFMGQDPDRVGTIICHPGNGASICVMKYGQVVDNSMGSMPLEDLAMGAWCGDMDPGALEFLSGREELDSQQIMTVLSQGSGVLDISRNFSSDFRELKDAEVKYHEKAALAREIFAYKVTEYVGSYAAAMNGVDSIVFTAGIGENDSDIREKIYSYLEYLDIATGELKNQEEGEVVRISDASSKVSVLMIRTNKGLEIARGTATVTKGLKKRPEKVRKGS